MAKVIPQLKPDQRADNRSIQHKTITDFKRGGKVGALKPQNFAPREPGLEPGPSGTPQISVPDPSQNQKHGGSTHPGFKAVQSKIEGEGYSAKSAGAILAASSRGASKKAKRANPRLKRV
jgi:hypothetical protein